MISEVTITIEHGEDTDALTAFVEAFDTGEVDLPSGLNLISTEVKVDTPDPLGEALASITWEQRGRIESGMPLYSCSIL